MCVILVSEKKRLSSQLIADAIRTNPHGNGFAWIAAGTVRFEKDITIAQAQELAAIVPMPYVFHARIATQGGITPTLCHPFPMDRTGDPRRLSGSSKAGVLFHNGTWHNWQDVAIAAIPCRTCEGKNVGGHVRCEGCAGTGIRIPQRFDPWKRSEWSDSLAMARIGAELGADVVEELVPDFQRLAIVTPTGVRTLGRGWTQIARGIRGSNDHFLPIRLRTA